MSNQLAPEGQMFVCAVCRKRSKQALDSGYDESCMMNAVLVYEQKNIVTPDQPYEYTAVPGRG